MVSERRILIVDDEQPIRDLFMRTLARLGCSIEGASSAGEALEIMGRQPAEILFLDLNLPGMNGLELCRTVSRQWPWAIPIAVTGYASMFELLACREAGFEDYFVKPVVLTELLTAGELACKKVARWKRR
jgi:CheY-like chemotaxis protein